MRNSATDAVRANGACTLPSPVPTPPGMDRDDADRGLVPAMSRGDIDVPIAADREMPGVADPLRDDAGMKARRQDEAVRFICNRRRRGQHQGKSGKNHFRHYSHPAEPLVPCETYIRQD